MVLSRRAASAGTFTVTAGNHERVARLLRGHTAARHYLSPRTWLRPLTKAARHLRETAVCLRYRTAEDVARTLGAPGAGLPIDRDDRPALPAG